ncbi:glycosyltransferase family 4 protein [Hyphobacterium sp. CCMP332]|nr:glycosyltransferase family 4 protein [Hyphobacterium sp. CCMP332]
MAKRQAGPLSNIKKISILSQYFHPEMGAPPNRLLETMRGFKNRGYEVSVVTGMPNYPKGIVFEDYRSKRFIQEELEGCTVFRYNFYTSNSKRAIPRIWSMITFSLNTLRSYNKLRKIKPDVVFVESPPLLLGFTGWILSRRLKAKFLFNISDIWPLSAKEMGAINDGYLYKFLEGIESFLYQRSDLISGQSQEIIDHIRSKTKTKAILFRNGVDINRFKNHSVIVHSGEKQKIVYAGLLGFAQGIVDICKKVDFNALNCEFHIYGDGGERQELLELIEAKPDSAIHYHGTVSRDEIPQIISQYDTYLVPLARAIYGAVPSKIYEAMASGKAILFFGEGEGAAIVEKYKLGYCAKTGDFETLKKNIALLNNSEQRKIFENNALQTAKLEFDRNVIIDNFISKMENEFKFE